MPELQINGRKIVLRETFPAGEFYDLPKKWAEEDELDFAEWAKLMGRFIVSWEYEGSPQDPQAWERLDAFRDIARLRLEINRFIIGMISDAKNSGSGSISPASSPGKKKSRS